MNLYHAPMAAETHPRQRWIKLGLESAAVLVSILTAFAIDAGWDRLLQSKMSRLRSPDCSPSSTRSCTGHHIVREALAVLETESPAN